MKDPRIRHSAKPLLKVAGALILSHVLARIEAIQDLTEVIIVGNHRFSEPITARRCSASYCVLLTLLDDGISEPEQRRGAMGNLSFALSVNSPEGDNWLVVAGDNLLGFDLLPSYRF